MYIARIKITDNRQKLANLNHLGAWHNWVERSFDEVYKGVRPRHLWRIENSPAGRFMMVLYDVDGTGEQINQEKFARFGEGPVEIKDYKPFVDSFKAGEVLNFRLTANPTYRIFDGKKSKIVPHVTTKQKLDWLISKGPRCGFEVINATLTGARYERLRKSHSRGGKLSVADFAGVLRVTDVDKFRETLINGIGREKAYGMGWLIVGR